MAVGFRVGFGHAAPPSLRRGRLPAFEFADDGRQQAARDQPILAGAGDLGIEAVDDRANLPGRDAEETGDVAHG